MNSRSIFIGWDPREAAAFAVARHTMRQHMSRNIPVRGLVLEELGALGLHSRPMTVGAAGKLFDKLSSRPDYDGAISTEHANARFLTPFLVSSGWAMFCDGDILVRSDVNELFDSLDPAMAVYCVKHDYAPTASVKMDGQAQTRYGRKNWSSVMVVNVDHEANKALTIDMVNSLPGRDLHAFCWLPDGLIGELDPAWNWLVGHSDPAVDPKLVHFTSGVPDMPGYGNVAFAEEWRSARRDWAIRG